MELKWSDFAIASLGEIAEYVNDNFSARLAQEVVDRIVARVNILRSQPRIGRLCRDMSMFGEVRCLTFKQNQIFYKIVGDRIEIAVVWVSRRDPEQLIDRLLDYFRSANF